MDAAHEQSWFTRHEFLLRRLHSLSGLVPVGLYMIVHLTTNSLILVSESTFQNAVYQIHMLGPLLWTVEWGLIFLPLIFHAVFGVVIIMGGRNNVSNYPYAKNWRYTLQRITGVVALLFIFFHVFHFHGWLHFDFWLKDIAEPMGMARFRPYNAASTVAESFQASWFMPVVYTTGILACVYHLANGIWTMGITWGIWTTPKGQTRANFVCTGIGAIVAVIGMSAMVGFLGTDAIEARQIEDRMYEQRVEDGSIIANEHKRVEEHFDADESETLEAGE